MNADPTLPEGFTAHDGSPCPVPEDQVVTVLFADGMIETTVAGYWDDGGEKWWEWECPYENCHIVGYKVEV